MKYQKLSNLPPEIARTFSLDTLLSLGKNAVVISLDRENGAPAILKIIPSAYFDRALTDALQALNQPCLLLPQKIFFQQGYVYAIYPKYLSLTEYLMENSLSLSVLSQLVQEIGELLSCLHQARICHGDIAPGNIYLDEEGHFCLGDFSSSEIIPSPWLPSLRRRKKTGTTYPAPLALSGFSQDSYSFLTLLSQISQNLRPPGEPSEKLLSALRSKTASLTQNLLELENLSFSQVYGELLDFFAQWEGSATFHERMIFSPDSKDFLEIATPEIKSRSLFSPSTGNSFTTLFHGNMQKKLTLPLAGLACCSLIFLSALIYTITGSRLLPHKSPPQGITAQKRPAQTSSPGVTLHSGQTSSPGATSHSGKSSSPSATLRPAQTSFPGATLLDISGSGRKEIPAVSERASIRVLFAEKNKISSLASLSGYASLEELYLDTNIIKDLGKLPPLKKLSILGLSNNQLRDVSPLSRLSSLTILDLSCQKSLKHLASLTKLKQLKYLVLTDTNAAPRDIRYLQRRLPRCTILY